MVFLYSFVQGKARSVSHPSRERLPVTGLVRYDAMCKAIAACHTVDEVKEIRDKARALEVYAQQALNTEAEHKAAEIRIRAERKAGEMLREMKLNGSRQNHGRPRTGKSSKRSDAPTISNLGISKDQSSQWQRLAEIPEDEFEEAVSKPGPKPSTEGMVNARLLKAHPPPRLDPDARDVWGLVKDFERHLFLERDPKQIADRMLDFMREDMERIVPQLIKWLKGLL